MSSPRVVQSASSQSASWRIRELSSNHQSPSINRNGPQRRRLSPQRHFDCRLRVRVRVLLCRKTSQNGQPSPKQVRCSRIQLLWCVVVHCGSVSVISHTLFLGCTELITVPRAVFIYSYTRCLQRSLLPVPVLCSCSCFMFLLCVKHILWLRHACTMDHA